MTYWGHSSVGRAPALQAGGQEFKSPCLHQETTKKRIYTVQKKLLKQITIKSTKYSSTMKTAYHQKNIALDIKDRKTTTAY